MMLNARRVQRKGESTDRILLAIEDVTDKPETGEPDTGGEE
jgi:hypothetical protein